MALDAFMVIDGKGQEREKESPTLKPAKDGIEIDGESRSEAANKHGGFDIHSFSWGVRQNVSSNSYVPATAPLTSDEAEQEDDISDDSKLEMESFEIEKEVDTSTPQFFFAAARGFIFKSGTIFFRKNSGAGTGSYTFLLFHFLDLQIVDWNLKTGDAAPSETIRFLFSRVRMKYVTQNSEGIKGVPNIRAWDRLENGYSTVPKIPAEYDQI